MKQLGYNSITGHPRHPFFPSPHHRKSASPDKSLRTASAFMLAVRDHGTKAWFRRIGLALSCVATRDLRLNDECILHHVFLIILHRRRMIFHILQHSRAPCCLISSGSQRSRRFRALIGKHLLLV